MEVDPTGNEAVTITLPETTDCNAARAICTDDERMLSHTTSVRVAGPPAISVSDATVQEAEGAVLEFSVTLSHAFSRTITVDLRHLRRHRPGRVRLHRSQRHPHLQCR